MMAFRDFLKSDKVYTPADVYTVIDNIKPFVKYAYAEKKKYFNMPCSFDIETSSFYNAEHEKVAIMYEWTLGLYGFVIVGRTWQEFQMCLETIVKCLDITPEKHLIIYVHNLAFEFGFIQYRFTWDKVFAIDSRKPIYAITDSGIEFRCSYLLSGYSLEKLGDELQTYEVKKLVGALDYEKLRHSSTPMSDKEISYCVNDVKVVMAYIAERIKEAGNIARIPLTKSGYVRTYCRNSCFYEDGKPKKKSFKRWRYMDMMKGLKLCADEYKQLKRAFQGGFTHANPFYSGKVMENVTSYDFTSSYPAVMLSERFPMSSGQLVHIQSREQFERNLRLYCCLFDVHFIGLQSQLWQDSYISQSRCWGVERAVINNGRIVSADSLYTTVTEQDYLIISKFYTWEKIEIGTFRRYRKDYFPTDFVKAILKLYQDKTTLKGVDGKEVEYLKSKEMLNSCYGMAVTDIVRDEHPFTDHWLTADEMPQTDVEKAIAKYNGGRGRFLFYPWGVWVTAYARRNLFTGIVEFGDDYVYSDTDSIKAINAERHMAYIEKYNEYIRNRLYAAMDHHGLPHEAIEPETKEGKKKCLGVWDFDGHYEKFKTLGAKRYLVQYAADPRNKKKDYHKVQLTVSGLNKQKCIPWMLEKWGDSIWDHFNDGLYVPQEHTGKMTHTYIDEHRDGVLIDYTGKPGEYHELSGVHLEKADYSLSISREYADFIRGIQEDEW